MTNADRRFIIELRAPTSKFRVVGVDTFDGDDWVVGDYPTLDEAKAVVRDQTKGKEMLKMHVYDEDGRHLFDAGVF